MSINKLLLRLTNDFIGEDQFGNKYYQTVKADKNGNKKRFVIYKGSNEPSKVPPLWHAWLHYLTNDIPTKRSNLLHKWQIEHKPNLTGTQAVKLEHNVNLKKYNSWQPN